jgi:hypothetical protein
MATEPITSCCLGPFDITLLHQKLDWPRPRSRTPFSNVSHSPVIFARFREYSICAGVRDLIIRVGTVHNAAEGTVRPHLHLHCRARNCIPGKHDVPSVCHFTRQGSRRDRQSQSRLPEKNCRQQNDTNDRRKNNPPRSFRPRLT